MERLKSWRLCGRFGVRNTAAAFSAAAARLVGEELFGDVVSAKKLWGEERDSWWNKGFAPYFATQWIGVLPGPGPDDPPNLSTVIDED